LVYFRSMGTTKWVVHPKPTFNVYLLMGHGHVSRPRHTVCLRLAHLAPVTNRLGSSHHRCSMGFIAHVWNTSHYFVSIDSLRFSKVVLGAGPV
jgi:hypothetical protein